MLVDKLLAFEFATNSPRSLSPFDNLMHAYRTHHCAQLRKEAVGQNVRLSGWVYRKRDFGNLLFIDLRDHYGVSQIVVEHDSPA